ncbi:group XV phospholipase A2-like [Copidosoma floridanum]|uniref:group XV phospholipase A2-like n=1 Tax=Copidosoma floridanum TaxID=29053 RepID=UPI0006C961AC|nr:group XV phospholipase A2-like [Copidosoma floridanum]
MRLLGLTVFVTVLICYVSLIETFRFRGKQRSPVIFIPGDGGNQLEASLNKTTAVHYLCEKVSNGFFNIWLNLELLVPIIIDCWIDNMKLIYDNETRETKNPDGVDIRVAGWGDPFVVEYLDPSRASPGSYFNNIGNMLVTKLGYVRNVSLKGAPYDFRKGPNENEEYFILLKALIEETYTNNNNSAVTLIAHSMGGPMSLLFLQRQTQLWKNKYISSLITLAGAWGGSVKALKVFAIGDDLGALLLRGKILKDQQITSPSLGWLLPSKLFWKNDEVLVETQLKNYTFADMREYLIDINVPNAWEFRKDNEKYQLDFRAPGVELHCLHGEKVQTVEKLLYKAGVAIDGSPELVPGDGDGTVNQRSLEGCTHWKGQQKQKIYHQPFPGVDHMKILSDAGVIDYVRKVLDFN